MKRLTVRTEARIEMIDITDQLRAVLKEEGVSDGVCYVFVPHTTAALTINENADPDVSLDILTSLEKLIPLNDPYRHIEGNAAAHIKAALLGPSEAIFIEKGDFVFGMWQSVFFCEFDGPRSRQVLVNILPAA
ncbi:MAG: secondary thiamine-phosphate synthase enzyme YjbQ [Smithellaceae bacterium]|nr:secondary thiamine-phosphate synthase enzyme YjbQ [Smithellaceae bacterium]